MASPATTGTHSRLVTAGGIAAAARPVGELLPPAPAGGRAVATRAPVLVTGWATGLATGFAAGFTTGW